jgi:uncharacterized protein YukE
MAIDDLPQPVANFLNVIGVPWPYVNEDTVMEFASLVRQFRQAVQTTHQDATETVAAIAKAHMSASIEAMQSGWAKLSAQHVDELLAGSAVLADALDTAANYIVAQKAQAIEVLAGMAAAFCADQAAASLTAGLSEPVVSPITEGAEAVVKSLAADLEQYVIGMVIGVAAKPLFAKVDEALTGLDWSKSRATAGTPEGFELHPAAVRAHTQALRDYATTLRAHGAAFQAGVEGLSF